MSFQEINEGDVLLALSRKDNVEFTVLGAYVHSDDVERFILACPSNVSGISIELMRNYFGKNVTDKRFNKLLEKAEQLNCNVCQEAVVICCDSDRFKILRKGNGFKCAPASTIKQSNLTDDEIRNRRFFFGDLEKPHVNVNSGLEFL
jgi:hypothetical protein